ncbi:DNA repair protein [Trichocladium antarcticum]|uniref:DNA repair protein REV1 n=1 Tax=Trichocladium antarcticum TaxID=1450529 RepID=A0AAN6UD97_9PEZI|nr:DNA repair protein [Trichocladium antarcticum]
MGSRLEKNSAAVRKRIVSHEFDDEDGDEYKAIGFGRFGDYMERKKLKLQNLDVELRAASADKAKIFNGVVAHVTGYTQPPLHVLHKELVQHGAGFLQYLDGKTMATHVIASAMPPKKSVDFTKYRVVKPAWVMDSIQAGRLLPWTDYRVLDDGPRQKTIRFDGGQLLSQAAPQSPAGYREQTQNSFYTSQFQKPAARLDAHGPGSPFRPVSAKTPAPADKSPDQAVNTPPPPSGKPVTSEEHNALLLADPKIRKSSTGNPDFLKQYYAESRLHHLSTWKAQLKSRLQRLAAEKAPKAKGPKRKSGSRRYIVHVDFDSFFCAVSLKHAPEYRDKPAVVSHGTGSGSEIASCNYPAREFGVKNGMWMKRALELCPDLKTLPYDFPGYEEASRHFYDAILDVGGRVQSVSIDEALVDITDVVLLATGSADVGVSDGSIRREQEKADEIASNLRAEIKKRTACHVSVGIGANILQAKIALRKAKPAGQYQIKPEEVLDLLAGLKVEDLPGVAYSIGGRLEEIGVKSVRDLRQTSKEKLVSLLGPRTGEKLWDYARGTDRTEVGEQPIRKSVSADVNWGIRFVSQEEAEEFVRNLCKELERRLLNEGVKGKHLTMKIMRRALDAPLDPAKHLGHGKCDTFNKSAVFGVATNDAEMIGKEAVSILRSYKFSPGDLRGLGVQMTKLEPLNQSAAPEGSQKKLTFASFNATPTTKRQKTEPIDDDANPPEQRHPSRPEFEQDPITVDPLTPRKPKIHPALALAKANAADAKANSPLNIGGTQFIIPSNLDPTVLAELPPDIRTRLLNQARRLPPRPPSPSPATPLKSRSHTPALAEPDADVEPDSDPDDIPSDVDPEVFRALPDEMKAEVRAWKRRDQTPAARPQSPRRDRVLQRPRERATPTKRGGGGGGGGGIRSLFGRVREQQQQQQQGGGGGGVDGGALRQTSLAPQPPGAGQLREDGGGGLDPAFLAELPEDVRREVVEDHRRRQQQQRRSMARGGGLRCQLPAAARRAQDGGGALPPRGQARLEFPARPTKIAFTQSGVTSLGDVKEMVGVWHEATRAEGPHRADVEVFARYAGRVVAEERDMEKARVLVKWLEWVVEEEKRGGPGQESWREAVGAVKKAVQGAMAERGLGPMDFG